MVVVESPLTPARDMRCVRCGFPFASTEDRMFVKYILVERPNGSKLSCVSRRHPDRTTCIAGAMLDVGYFPQNTPPGE